MSPSPSCSALTTKWIGGGGEGSGGPAASSMGTVSGITPVIPASADKLLSLIDAGEGGTPIAPPAPLFPRLELEEEEAA